MDQIGLRSSWRGDESIIEPGDEKVMAPNSISPMVSAYDYSPFQNSCLQGQHQGCRFCLRSLQRHRK